VSAQWLFPVCDAGFKAALRLFAKVRIEGRENVPRTGPLIVVSNHLSNIDPAIVAAAVDRTPGFLAKRELFRFPPLAVFLYGYGAFPVDRERTDLKALRWAVKRLHRGGVIVLFPERTRSRGRGLLKAQYGAPLLASMTGAPLLPVAITGSEPLQNYLKVFAPVSNLHIRIGRPFMVKAGEKATREQLEKATVEMMSRIARMLPPEYRGHYADRADIPHVSTEDVELEMTDRRGARH
jgi:1-acyl-sn-glycerol-3-phosphate acyltransferase